MQQPQSAGNTELYERNYRTMNEKQLMRIIAIEVVAIAILYFWIITFGIEHL
jgi:hypothetical protein